MSREMAASGAMNAQRHRTRLLCAQRKENMTCLAAAATFPRSALCAPACHWLRAGAPARGGLWLLKNFIL